MAPNNFPLRVHWTQEGHIERTMIQNRSEGLALFNKVHAISSAAPTMVEYAHGESGRAFAIGAGRSETVLTFQATNDPPYFTSRGRPSPLAAEIWFLYAGENTPYPGFSAVPIADGVHALEYFLDSAERSPVIEWEQL